MGVSHDYGSVLVSSAMGKLKRGGRLTGNRDTACYTTREIMVLTMAVCNNTRVDVQSLSTPQQVMEAEMACA
jgi:hypothetical protein